MGILDKFEQTAATAAESSLIAKLAKYSDTEKIGPVSRAETYEHNGKTWDGYFDLTVTELAEAAGLVPGVYACGRAVHSEDHRANIKERLVIAECIRRDAQVKNVSVVGVLTRVVRPEYAWTRNYVGEQKGRRHATTRQGCRQCLEIAKFALYNPTNFAFGASKYLSPGGQGKLQNGVQTRSFISVVTDWAEKSRYQWVGHIPGVRTERVMCFRRQPKGQTADPGPAIEWYTNRGVEPSGNGQNSGLILAGVALASVAGLKLGGAF